MMEIDEFYEILVEKLVWEKNLITSLFHLLHILQVDESFVENLVCFQYCLMYSFEIKPLNLIILNHQVIIKIDQLINYITIIYWLH